MKKMFSAISALVICLAIGQYVMAAATSSVTTTVTMQNISLTVADGVVNYGTLAADTIGSTRSPVDLQTVTNNGNVAEDFNIQGQDATGSTQTWTLAATTGSAQYIHGFCTVSCTTAPTNYTALTTGYSTLASDIAAAGTQTFDLYIKTPTVTTDFTSHTANVVVQASAH